jgi:hypothetical protein
VSLNLSKKKFQEGKRARSRHEPRNCGSNFACPLCIILYSIVSTVISKKDSFKKSEQSAGHRWNDARLPFPTIATCPSTEQNFTVKHGNKGKQGQTLHDPPSDKVRREHHDNSAFYAPHSTDGSGLYPCTCAWANQSFSCKSPQGHDSTDKY